MGVSGGGPSHTHRFIFGNRDLAVKVGGKRLLRGGGGVRRLQWVHAAGNRADDLPVLPRGVFWRGEREAEKEGVSEGPWKHRKTWQRPGKTHR